MSISELNVNYGDAPEVNPETIIKDYCGNDENLIQELIYPIIAYGEKILHEGQDAAIATINELYKFISCPITSRLTQYCDSIGIKLVECRHPAYLFHKKVAEVLEDRDLSWFINHSKEQAESQLRQRLVYELYSYIVKNLPKETLMGTMTIRSNKLYVSDPCYSLGTWCQGILDNVRNGIWNCYIKFSNEGNWGTRVKEIIIKHSEYKAKPTKLTNIRVGVDSGQAGFYDSVYYEQYHTNELDNEWYDRIGNMTLSGISCGILDDKCFVSSSGYGDGSYNCYISKNAAGEIVSAKIRYI